MPGKAEKPAKSTKARRRGRDADTGPPRPPGRFQRWVRRVALWTVGAVVVVGAVFWGLRRLEAGLLSEVDSGRIVPVRITLDRRPNWMPESLAREITDELARKDEDFRDPALTRRVYERAAAHPWVRTASFARRLGRDDSDVGQVELCVEFRRPLARVLGADGFYRYVDEEACVLPPRQIPHWVVSLPAADGKPAEQTTYLSEAEVPAHRRAASIHYVTIRGVQAKSPGVGGVWKGDDLRDGLRLVKLLRDKPYVNQIPVIDVHRAPYLKLYAQFRQGRRTDIEFGHFPQPKGDYVVPVQRKLAYLDGYVAQNDGRLAGIDKGLTLYYDELYVTPY